MNNTIKYALRQQTAHKLRRIAEGCSKRAEKELHYLQDDLEHFLETNEEIEEYNHLLDTLTQLDY